MTPAPDSLPALLATAPVFDAHVDSLQRGLDLGHDLGRRTPGHLDLEQGAEGGLGQVVFVCWVDPAYLEAGPEGAVARTDALLDEYHRLLGRHPDRLAFGGNGERVRAAREAGLVAGIPGIEGGHSIAESLEELERFFVRGVRVMTLVWNNHLSWIRSCRDGAGPDTPAGLSEFGREVVRTMNRLGMVVDLSHAGRQSFFDALEVSSKPVIASHSGCMQINEHPRNLDDEQLRALAANRGVIGIVFCIAFLDAEAGAEDDRVQATAGYEAIEDDNPTGLFMRQGDYLQEHCAALSIERVLDHAMHAIEIAGVESVGVGSDFDGILRRPAGLESAACYGVLAEGLMRRGLDLREVELVLGGNMRRVFDEVTGPGTVAAEAALGSL